MLRMAPWVVRPRLPDPAPKAGPLLMQGAKHYRRPAERAKVSGPVLLVEARSGGRARRWPRSPRSRRDDRGRPGSCPWPGGARRVAEGLGRGEQARQRRHDQVEAEVVQLARRERAASCRLDHVRHQHDSGSAAAIASSSSTDSGASTNTASTPRSAAAFARSPRRARTARVHRCGAVTCRWVRRRPRPAASPATPHAARPACRPCDRTAWATPGPRGRSRPRPPPPRARPCARR